MKISAAVAHKPQQPFVIQELELGSPRSNEVLVALKGVGICHTDLYCKDASSVPIKPAVLGHEGVGIVQQIGSDVTKLNVGDAVVLSFGYCGDCVHCNGGEPTYCEDFIPLNQMGARADGSSALSDGGDRVSSHFFGQSSFATHCVTYENNCIKVQNDIDLPLLAPLGCGIQTGAGAVMNSLDMNEGHSLLVAGGGTVGLSAVMAAAAIGCHKIVVVDPLQSRRDIAIELGATDAISPSDDLAGHLSRISQFGYDRIIDTTARDDLIELLIGHLAIRGTIGLLGVPHDPSSSISFSSAHILAGGRRITGIIEGDIVPQEFIPKLIALYQNGKFPFDKLVKRYPFSEINQAIEDQKNGKCVKPLLVF